MTGSRSRAVVVAGAVAVGIATVAVSDAQRRMTPWEYQQQETARYFRGLASVQTQGWGPINARVLAVEQQLIDYSGKVFRVVPGQSFQWGQAHAGGWIILDISSASAEKPILAFRLAHEWGHEALGHQPNIYQPSGSPWRFRATPTADEDAADEYAGKFLATYHYDLDSVTSYLRSLPAMPGDFQHSDGPRRARIVETAYESVPNVRVSISATPTPHATPGSPPTHTSDSTSLADRLRQLKDAHDQGLISDDEYRTARRRALNGSSGGVEGDSGSPAPTPDTCLQNCADDFDSCISDVPTVEDCVAEMPEKCIDTCVESYGHTRGECISLYCTNSSTNLQSWNASCHRKVARKKARCRDEERDCKKECRSD